MWDDPAYPELSDECAALAEVVDDSMELELTALLAKYEAVASQQTSGAFKKARLMQQLKEADERREFYFSQSEVDLTAL